MVCSLLDQQGGVFATGLTQCIGEGKGEACQEGEGRGGYSIAREKDTATERGEWRKRGGQANDRER